MNILIAIFVLFFSYSLVAEDISDFEIEGISIGDSLLQYMSKEEIKEEIAVNKYMYHYLTDEFGEVYLYKNFKTYKFLSFFVKPNDSKYKIYSIRGTMPHQEDLNKCYEQMEQITSEFKISFKKTKTSTSEFNHRIDPSGESKVISRNFTFDNGDVINIMCINFEEKLRISNNWIDGLDINIRTYEFRKWINSE
tara:strand:+ start:892 stop:1473 length:582 start_codon:yes stop_codon:yes gene_type:complete